MGSAFRVIGRMSRDVFDDFLLLVMCNMIWALLCYPLLILAFAAIAILESPLVATGLLLLNVLPMGPASVALAAVAYRICDGRTATVGDYFRAMRTYARIGWLLMGIWVAGFCVHLLNISFYAQMESLVGSLLYGLWIYILLIWFALLIYMFPLTQLQVEPNFRMLVRNTLLMIFGRPVFTLLTVFLMGVMVAISLLLPIFIAVMTISVLAVWGMRATMTLIAEERAKREKAEGITSAAEEEKGRRGQVRPK